MICRPYPHATQVVSCGIRLWGGDGGRVITCVCCSEGKGSGNARTPREVVAQLCIVELSCLRNTAASIRYLRQFLKSFDAVFLTKEASIKVGYSVWAVPKFMQKLK